MICFMVIPPSCHPWIAIGRRRHIAFQTQP
jgi:hypothetical protein